MSQIFNLEIKYISIKFSHNIADDQLWYHTVPKTSLSRLERMQLITTGFNLHISDPETNRDGLFCVEIWLIFGTV